MGTEYGDSYPCVRHLEDSSSSMQNPGTGHDDAVPWNYARLRSDASTSSAREDYTHQTDSRSLRFKEIRDQTRVVKSTGASQLCITRCYSRRSFVSYLLSLSSSVKELSHHVKLGRECLGDIHMWRDFLDGWNGVSLFL